MYYVPQSMFYILVFNSTQYTAFYIVYIYIYIYYTLPTISYVLYYVVFCILGYRTNVCNISHTFLICHVICCMMSYMLSVVSHVYPL